MFSIVFLLESLWVFFYSLLTFVTWICCCRCFGCWGCCCRANFSVFPELTDVSSLFVWHFAQPGHVRLCHSAVGHQHLRNWWDLIVGPYLWKATVFRFKFLWSIPAEIEIFFFYSYYEGSQVFDQFSPRHTADKRLSSEESIRENWIKGRLRFSGFSSTPCDYALSLEGMRKARRICGWDLKVYSSRSMDVFSRLSPSHWLFN